MLKVSKFGRDARIGVDLNTINKLEQTLNEVCRDGETGRVIYAG